MLYAGCVTCLYIFVENNNKVYYKVISKERKNQDTFKYKLVIIGHGSKC